MTTYTQQELLSLAWGVVFVGLLFLGVIVIMLLLKILK